MVERMIEVDKNDKIIGLRNKEDFFGERYIHAALI
jgi:hypothetical protein